MTASLRLNSWDHPLQDGNDTENNLVVVVLSVSASRQPRSMHLKRSSHPDSLVELELQMQELLEPPISPQWEPRDFMGPIDVVVTAVSPGTAPDNRG